MTFFADESVDRQIVEAVTGLGYDVVSIAETSPGIPDTEVLRRANDSQSVLKGFGELVFRQRGSIPGSSCSALRDWPRR